MTSKAGLRFTTMLGAKLLLMPAVAQAQQIEAPGTQPSPPVTSQGVLRPSDEVVVTARRGNERLLDVPASVSVLSEATITRAGITNVEQAVNLTPGVSIVTNTAEVGDTQINIRGLNGARDAESNVGLVVDGILKTNSSVLNQDQGDLTQLEVLKGPQGAYYGRNAEAGAIVIQTRKPGDHFELRAKASYGNFNTYTGFVSASGPLSDTTGLLISGDYRKTDGFYRNNGPIPAAQGATIDQFEGYNINARLMSDVTDRLSIDAKGRIGHNRSGSINYNVVFALPNFAAINPAFYNDVNQQPYQFTSNDPSDGHQTTKEGSLKADWDLGAAKLVAWGLYSDVKQDLIADAAVAAFGFFNATPECRSSVARLNAAGYKLPAPQVLGQVPESSLFVPNGSLISAFSPTTCDGSQYQVRNQRDVSFEARLVSKAGDPLSWSVGAYYLNIRREVGVNLGYDRGLGLLRQLYAPPGSINPTEELVHDRFRTNVYAGFGSLDYKFTDALHLSAALRYDREERHVVNLVDPTLRNQYVLGGNQPLNVGLLNGGVLSPKTRAFAQLQPKIALLYKPSDNLSLFADWGIGFKSGGFNSQGSKAAIDLQYNQAVGSGLNINDDYDKERSSAYETGFKAHLFGGRATLEGAGYYTDIHNMQFFEFYVGSFGILRVVSDIDKVRIYGAELGGTVKLNDALSLFASGNANDSRIQKNAARPNTVGGKSPYTADYTVNAGADLTLPLTRTLQLVGRVDARLTGPTWFSTAQQGTQPTVFTALLPLAGLPAALGSSRLDKARRDAFTTANLRVGVQGERWKITGYANNLFNERYLSEVIPAPDFGGSFISPGDLRAYGVELAYRF